MTKKQRDLKKLKAYAKALGLKTIFKKGTRSDPGASWSTDLVLTLYVRSYTTQKLLILNFIHELAHMAHWIDSKKVQDDMLFDALNMEDGRAGKHSLQVDKSMRKLIYDDEVIASAFRESIRRQLDLESITETELLQDIKLDIWIYNYYHYNGEFPTIKAVSNARNCNIFNSRRK